MFSYKYCIYSVFILSHLNHVNETYDEIVNEDILFIGSSGCLFYVQ